MVSIYNTCNNTLQERKITTIKFRRELTSGKQRQNEGAVIKYSDADVFSFFCRRFLANVSFKLPSFTEKHHGKHWIPTFFLQSDKHTHAAKVTYRHEKNKNKNKTQALNRRHLERLIPTKRKRKNKKVVCLLFRADVCLADELPLPMI